MGTRGGKREGAGRKKGQKDPATLEKEAVLIAFRQRAMGVASKLLDAQLTLARGMNLLYKIEKEWVKTGTSKSGKENGYYRKLKPVLVENEMEISQYLEGLIDEGDEDDDQDPGATYYFITTKPPDNNAIDSILDRTFGKATQAVEVSGTMKISKLEEIQEATKKILE